MVCGQTESISTHCQQKKPGSKIVVILAIALGEDKGTNKHKSHGQYTSSSRTKKSVQSTDLPCFIKDYSKESESKAHCTTCKRVNEIQTYSLQY